MENLKEILEWLSQASETQINALNEVIVYNHLNYLDDVVGREAYKEFIKDIEENAINNATCYKCDCEINGEIYCVDCLVEDKLKEKDNEIERLQKIIEEYEKKLGEQNE